jgi:replicative DNA helicase
MGDVVPFRRADPPNVAGRVPPHDLDAEAAVLSAIVLDREALAKVLELLRPEHFYSEANARIYQVAQALTREQTPLDWITIRRRLGDLGWLDKVGGSQQLQTLIDATPAVQNVLAHAFIVLEKWEDRSLIAACHRRASEGYQIPGERTAWRAEVRAEMGRLTAPRTRLVGRPVGAAVDEAREHVRASSERRLVGVRYPWIGVENLVGLMVAGRQTVLAGLSEHGKTTAAMQIAEHVACTPLDALGIGESVYVHSAEMKRGPLLLRMACCFAGYDVLAIEGGTAHPDAYAAVHVQLDRLESLPIIVDDEPASASEIAKRVLEHRAMFAAGTARTEQRQCPECGGPTCARCGGSGQLGGVLLGKRRLRLVIGDSAQELAAHEDGRDERARIETCAKGWARLAERCEVATVLLSLLRGPSEQEAKASKGFPPWPTWGRLFGAPTALKGSADTVLAVHRPELEIEGKIPAKWRGTAAICRLKSRYGGEGRRVYLGFDRGYFTDDVNTEMRQAMLAGDE